MSKKKLAPAHLFKFSAAADAWLRKESTRLGIPLTEFVRRLVDEKRGATATTANKGDAQ